MNTDNRKGEFHVREFYGPDGLRENYMKLPPHNQNIEVTNTRFVLRLTTLAARSIAYSAVGTSAPLIYTTLVV